MQSPNQSGAKLGTEYLAKLVGKAGKIAAVEGPTFAEVLVERNKGFAAGADAKGLDVIAKQTGSPAGPDAACCKGRWPADAHPRRGTPRSPPGSGGVRRCRTSGRGA